MKSETKRWTVKEIFFGSEHVSSQIWCYLKLSEMKSEMNRWTDEEYFFGYEHVSSQIWCYLKLVRWRDEEWDEEMNRWRKFFWVRTCIKSNLVLSEISEMKRWRVRWRDEEMKKKILGSEHVSSQICCQKFFPLPKKLHPSKQTDKQTYIHTDTIVTR